MNINEGICHASGGMHTNAPNPLYFHDGAHSMLFTSFEGQLMMALHCPNIHPLKKILLIKMEEKEASSYQ